MTKVSSSLFIPNVPPMLVRSTFLDFPHLTDWDKSYVTSLAPLLPSSPQNQSKTNPPIPDPSKITGEKLVPGDRLHATFWGGEAFLTVLENSNSALRWKGGKKVQGTMFTQSEEASGFMGGVLVVDGEMGGWDLKKKFAKFNEDLRGECVRRYEAEGKK
ncbi:uncharacterized protein PAC_05641 [Phialocephala subalpina]|uniref:Uncharacterized protein n=1 Tax=Phialocephala subalpina TaxID=576137 RepID=A0A1L7WSL6_9HELO|nr:uncharacterized protein PAC_05641 [Phialocephala subalpina]